MAYSEGAIRFVAGHMASSRLFDFSTELKRDVYLRGIFTEKKLAEVTSAEVATIGDGIRRRSKFSITLYELRYARS